MDNTIITVGHNDNAVVKTVYDPCPAGFKMPASNAFSGFSKTGDKTGKLSDFNVSGAWDNGWNFNNKLTTPDATIWFPASRFRNFDNGKLNDKPYGYDYNGYWTAVPFSRHLTYSCGMNLHEWYVGARTSLANTFGFAARPVADE